MDLVFARRGESVGGSEMGVTTDRRVRETGAWPSLVLLVHDTLGSGRPFDRVADGLASEFRMLWYDRRGYGESATLPSQTRRSNVASIMPSPSSMA